MKKEKLIAEYSAYIKDCDKIIEMTSGKLREMRRDPMADSLEIQQVRSDQRVAEAQRQRTVQFIKDLEDLI